MAGQRRRVRQEALDEVKDALTGHVTTLAGKIGKLIEEADKGEQWTCPKCGGFGPRVNKMGLREAAGLVQTLMTAIKEPMELTAVVPIQVIVSAGAPIHPLPLEPPQNPEEEAK
jgi:hypothetical protein